MPFTHVAANALIDAFIASHTSLWVGLFTATPNKSGGGTEVTGGSYARVEMDSDAIFDPASNSETDSTDVVAFPTATASWGSVTAVGLFDASSGGNLLAWYPLPTPRTVGNGDNVAFPVGNIILRNV